MARMLLTLGLAIYNNVANRWPPFNGAAYVPLNLATTIFIAFLAFGPLDLTLDQVAGSASWTDLAVGAALGALLAAPLFLPLVTARWGPIIADRRVSHLEGAALAYQCLIRVPLGTALLEEFAFRGVLYAAWKVSLGVVAAAAISSVVFGLWHIGPARNALVANRPDADASVIFKAIAGTVVVTAGAGAAMVALRELSGGIVAPFALHATLNSLATLAATRGRERTR